MAALIVTGTDTGAGKTWITLALMYGLGAQRRVLGMKPVASGCERIHGELRNEDALLIQAAGWKTCDYHLVNPYAFARPVAPHAAAAETGVEIELGKIMDAYEKLRVDADTVVVEGVGGWRVPYSENLALVDVARAMRAPVLLVVGVKLGCINHAVLSAEALVRDGVDLRGWVANQLEEDYQLLDATLSCLSEKIPAPLLGFVPRLDSRHPQKIWSELDTDKAEIRQILSLK